MRQSRLNLDSKDFATFAAWSDQDNLLSTCRGRGSWVWVNVVGDRIPSC